MFAVDVSGGDQAARALMTLATLYSRKLLIQTFKEAAKPFVKTSKAIAESLGLEDTGAMIMTIRARLARTRRGLVEIKVSPGKDQFYGLFHEYGTAYHAPNPFMTPAWMQQKKVVMGDLVGAMARVLDRTAKRLERKVRKGRRLTRQDEALLLA